MSFMDTEKPRVEPRIRAMVRAILRDTKGEREVCIIDVSTRGVLATAARPPARGEFVELQFGRDRIAGQVKWASERRFGLALQERVSVAALVEGGAGPVRLQGSRAAQRRDGGWLTALRASPEMMGRVGQLGFLLAAAACAALLIGELAGAGLAPVQQAVTAMNEGAGG